MKYMTSAEIREKYLSFLRGKGLQALALVVPDPGTIRPFC